jgi:hypothetical protein
MIQISLDEIQRIKNDSKEGRATPYDVNKETFIIMTADMFLAMKEKAEPKLIDRYKY